MKIYRDSHVVNVFYAHSLFDHSNNLACTENSPQVLCIFFLCSLALGSLPAIRILFKHAANDRGKSLDALGEHILIFPLATR
jgi:hypothetical protein